MLVKQRKEKDNQQLDFLHKVDEETNKGICFWTWFVAYLNFWLVLHTFGLS